MKFVPGKTGTWFGFGLVLLWLVACKAPSKQPDVAEAPKPLPLALETFDEAWRIIYEHHFDTNFGGVNWVQAKKEFRPKAATAQTTAELRTVIQEMLDLLKVSHLAIVPSEVVEDLEPEESGKNESAIESADEDASGTTGIHPRFCEGKILVARVDPGSPAEKVGVKTGWIISKIGELPSEKILEKIPSEIPGRRRAFLAWRRCSKLLSGYPGSSVKLEFQDELEKTVALQVERTLAPGTPIQFGNLPVLYADLHKNRMELGRGLDAGYIRFNIWMLPTAIAFNQAIEELRDVDGMIIDLRGNIGGLVGMIIGTGGHFFDEPLSLGHLVMRDNRLNLFVNPRRVDSKSNPVKPYSGPVAILVDEVTASASEVFAGGLQELGRARIFGSTTSGQALPAVYDRLPNGDALYHPFGDFITEKGTRFEGRGVVPDEEVPMDRSALLKGRDAALEAAKKWIQQSLSAKKE